MGELNMNSHNPCGHRRDGVGPDQQGFVEQGTAHHPVGQHGQAKRHTQAQCGHQQGEHSGGFERGQVGGVFPQPLEIQPTDEFAAGAKGVLLGQALVERLRRRPEEK